jgi:hypothetical protein
MRLRLRDILAIIQEVSHKEKLPETFICGGVPRDKEMNTLSNINDLDLTNGSDSINILANKVSGILSRKYNLLQKQSNDGHISLIVGNLKVDFSSHFIVDGVKGKTELEKEMFSRDFTCNSLLLTLDLKKIIDVTGRGKIDIKNKVLNTCLDPSITLTNSKNRVPRIVYMAAKLGFTVNPDIIEYVKNNPSVNNLNVREITIKKINEAIKYDAEKSLKLISQMNLWDYIPISNELQPYYQAHLKGEI